jgi:hypothetical protein
MKYRKLRIAWSVVCGILCLLLIVLWVRSYWWIDHLQRISSTFVSDICPYDGKLVFNWSDDAENAKSAMERHGEGWHLWKRSVESWRGTSAPPLSKRLFHPFSLTLSPNQLVIPFWAVAILSSILGALPWMHKMKWRFSLRTLLIATTLVAVLLGAVIYAVR